MFEQVQEKILAMIASEQEDYRRFWLNEILECAKKIVTAKNGCDVDDGHDFGRYIAVDMGWPELGELIGNLYDSVIMDDGSLAGA